VIDPVQSEKPDKNQVDSHCEAHDPGRNQQEHSRGQGSDWQKRLGSIGVHPGLIADSDASPPALASPVRVALAKGSGPFPTAIRRTIHVLYLAPGSLARRLLSLRGINHD